MPYDLYGSKVVLYFSSNFNEKKDQSNIILQLNELIKSQLTKYHLPKSILYFKSLPKTKSGKIMRRIMRVLAEKGYFDKTKDYSTLANKEEFLESARKFEKKDFNHI